MGAAAAIILRKEKDIVEIYRRAGATSLAGARTPDDLGVHRRVAFNLLVRHGALRDGGNDRYYLDEARWQELRIRRRRVAASMLIVVVVVFVALAAVGAITVGFGIPRLH